MKDVWLQTMKGTKLTPFNVSSDMVDIVEIAHALSKICRYNGHCNRFYSVAEHSMLMSEMVSDKAAMYALLHDAHEAYISDIITPLKPFAPALNEAMDNLQYVINEKYLGCQPTQEILEEVKEADKRMLRTEQLQLMAKTPHLWGCEHIIPYDIDIRCFGPTEAKLHFSIRYKLLMKAGHNGKL